MDNPFLEEIAFIIGAVTDVVERKRQEFFDSLYAKTGRGTVLPGERMEILLPLEIAEAWIMLESKPLDKLTLCEKFKAKQGWNNVWVEERRNPNGGNDFVIIFQS